MFPTHNCYADALLKAQTQHIFVSLCNKVQKLLAKTFKAKQGHSRFRSLVLARCCKHSLRIAISGWVNLCCTLGFEPTNPNYPSDMAQHVCVHPLAHHTINKYCPSRSFWASLCVIDLPISPVQVSELKWGQSCTHVGCQCVASPVSLSFGDHKLYFAMPVVVCLCGVDPCNKTLI